MRGRARRAAVAALSLALAAAGGQAARAEPAVALAYRAPDGCPDADAFRAALIERGLVGDASLEVAIEATPTGFRGVVRLPGEPERTLDGARCADVASGLALIAVLAVEVASVAAPAPPIAAPPPVVKRPAPPAGRPVALRVGAGVGVVGGALPDPELGVPLFGEIASAAGAWSARLAVTAMVGEVAGDDGATVADFALVLVAVEGCATPFRLAGGRVGGCLAVETGRMTAEGRPPLVDLQRETRAWLAPAGSLRGRWPLGRWLGVGAAIGAAFPLVRDRFRVADDVHVADPVGLRAAVDLGLSFW